MSRTITMLPGLIAVFGLFIFFQAIPVQSAQIQIEIFYLPHPPAMAVVGKIEQVAAEFKDVVIKKHNFEDRDTGRFLKKYNLTDHMPVAVFINGKESFTIGGRVLRLRNFPKGDSFVPMFAGEWDYSDLRAILAGEGR